MAIAAALNERCYDERCHRVVEGATRSYLSSLDRITNPTALGPRVLNLKTRPDGSRWSLFTSADVPELLEPQGKPADVCDERKVGGVLLRALVSGLDAKRSDPNAATQCPTWLQRG